LPRKPKGRWITEHGYVMLSGGKNSSGAYEHRIVMKEALNRELENNEIIHHIDGNKQNNKIENLKLTTLDEHNKHHLSNKIEARCGFCGLKLMVHPYKLKNNKSGLVFCNNSCKGKHFNGSAVRGKPFNNDEDEKILELKEKGFSYRKIGKILSRHNESIRKRYLRIKESE